MSVIVLDSSPLSALTQSPGISDADACRAWLAAKMAQGATIIVPEIVDYELRRELLRAVKSASLHRLDQLLAHPGITVLPLASRDLKRAAELWANVRQRGTPTADPHALDIDVILCAQVLAAGYLPADTVVATSNVSHLSLFLPAQLWHLI